MKKNILVVGFGNMGCRHVQALLQDKDLFDVHILETNPENITNNIPRIGAVKEDCKWYSSVEELPAVDVAIVATSSGPRFNIVKSLLEKGVTYFLLEKIVFQSSHQFNEILELVEKNGAHVYCNFVNRYFPVYNEIKNLVEKTKSPVEISLYGNAFGVGCNSIHYIDIFQYITSVNDLKIISSELEVLEGENRRGNQYKEFTGSLKIENSKKETLTLISDKDFTGGVVITIKAGNETFILSEQTQRYFRVSDAGVKHESFAMPPTSRLSNLIVKDILSGHCRLTRLKDTYKAHEELFQRFNLQLFGKHSETTLCPIT